MSLPSPISLTDAFRCRFAVRVIAFNIDGTLLATVSDKVRYSSHSTRPKRLSACVLPQGTVVRVFSIPDGQKLHTFRRGVTAAMVNSICFNEASSLIALSRCAPRAMSFGWHAQCCLCAGFLLSSSDSSTVHVFALAAAG